MNAHWSGWVFSIGGGALAGGGVLVLVWAVVGDRSRGRRRCRKCWYDMGSIGAVEGEWVCPECGKRAGRERLLLRSRRRWRWVGVACLVWVVSYFVWATPRVREEGWTGVVPTTVAVLGMGFLVPDIPQHEVFARPQEVLQVDGFRAELYRNLSKHRFGADTPDWMVDLCLWQARRAAQSPNHARWALASCIVSSLGWGQDASDKQLESLESLIHVRVLTRPEWRHGDEIFARVSLEKPSLWYDRSYQVEMTPLSDGLRPIVGRHDCFLLELQRRQSMSVVHETVGYELLSLGRLKGGQEPQYQVAVYRIANSPDTTVQREKVIDESTLTLPALIVGHDPETPAPSADRLAVRSAGRTFLLPGMRRDVCWLCLELEKPIGFDIRSVAVAGIGTISSGDRVCHEFRFWADDLQYHNTDRLVLRVEQVQRFPKCHESHILRLRGDPFVAMRQLGTTHYWDGEIEIPFN